MIFINPHIKDNEVIIRFFFKEKDKMYKVYMGINPETIDLDMMLKLFRALSKSGKVL